MATSAVITIREYVPADLEFVVEVDIQTTLASISDKVRAALDIDAVVAHIRETDLPIIAARRDDVLVAEVDGAPAGMIWFGTKPNPLSGRLEGWIFVVGVLAPYRSRGIGRTLISSAITRLREHGIAHVGLALANHNRGAIRLYESLGFTIDEYIMRAEVAQYHDDDPTNLPAS